MPPKMMNNYNNNSMNYSQNSPPASPRGNGRGRGGDRGSNNSRSPSPRGNYRKTLHNNQMLNDNNGYDDYGQAQNRGGRANSPSPASSNYQTQGQARRGRSPSPQRANGRSNNGGRSPSPTLRSKSPRAYNGNNYDDQNQGVELDNQGRKKKRFIVYDIDHGYKEFGDYVGALPSGAARKAATRGLKKVLIFAPKQGKFGKYYVYDANVTKIPQNKLTPFQKLHGMTLQSKVKRCDNHNEVVEHILNNPKIMAILQAQQGRMLLGSDAHRARARLSNSPKNVRYNH
jgi:hypothetical protein